MNEIFLLVLILVTFLAVAFYISKKIENLKDNKTPPELLEVIKILQQSSAQDRRELLSALQKNTNSLNERLDRAAQVISGVQKNIGEMSEIGRSMRELQEFLNSPKLRGNVGEQVLKELLGQMLPKQSFHLQYTFRSGEKVDAAIKTAAGIIPVDSKFPMENFRKFMGAKEEQEKKQFQKAFEKDVRNHIDSISLKYILTEEGTIDYALMYIPSEAVYYEVVNDPSLFDYASEKRVLPVSPTTFYAYLRAILMSFEGQKIEDKARDILRMIKAIQKDYSGVEDNLSILQKHVSNSYNSLSNVREAFSRLGGKISSVAKLDIKEKRLPSNSNEKQ